MMLDLNSLLKKSSRGPQDVVAVDLDLDGVRCVRLKRSNGEILVLAADILPPPENPPAPAEDTPLFVLPKPLIARHAAICVADEAAEIKLLNLPGQLEGDMEAHLRSQIGVEQSDYRIAYQEVGQGQVRTETKLLVVAIPDAVVQAACALFPAGIPAPLSVDLSGLAAINAFWYGPVKTSPGEALGVIASGTQVTLIAFFNRGELVLIRKFNFGYHHLRDKVQQSLGVERDTARDVISGGSFDISQLVRELTEPLVKQFVISKHFIERRENCHISRLYVPESKQISRDWLNEIKQAMGMDLSAWNPFDSVKMIPGILPPKWEGQQSLFASAIGAGLGAFEEKVPR